MPEIVHYSEGRLITDGGQNIPDSALTQSGTTATATALAELAARPAIVGKFGPQGSQVAVGRVSATLYNLMQHLGSRRWWRLSLQRSDTLSAVPPGGGLVHLLNDADISTPHLNLTGADASNVRTGSSWGPITAAAAFGGTYWRSTTSGESVTFTSPALATSVGIRAAFNTNNGLAKVTVDGSATAATNLPTAQNLVDAAIFPNTILVANGGTLNPTDRVIDMYASAATLDVPMVVADDLAPGVHTVVVTVTGYKRAASSDIRVAYSAFTYGTSAMTPATASVSMIPFRTLMGTTISAYCYAHQIKPTGGTTATFVGEVHGYETQDTAAPTFTLDGAALALSDGQVALGSTLVVTRPTRLHHPDIGAGATDIATVATTLTMSADGLRIQHTTTWLVATLVNASYPAMFPVLNTAFQKGSVGSVSVTMTAHDGTFKGNVPARTIAMWDNTSGAVGAGKAAVVLYVPDPPTTLNGFVGAATSTAGQPSFMAVQDNSANPMSKAYASRDVVGGATETPAAGTVWTSDSYRKAAWFPNGADAALAGV